MNTVHGLEQRLQDLGLTLAQHPESLALLGLGSVGLETDRLDIWSDLDFFVIVEDGAKKAWLADPSWLSDPHRVAYLFRNTVDGFKLLWDDGIFGEMAVFEAKELGGIPFAPGRVIWAREGFDTGILIPKNTSGTKWKPTDRDHVMGELLT